MNDRANDYRRRSCPACEPAEAGFAEAQPGATARDPHPRSDRWADDAADPDQESPRRRRPRPRPARARLAAGDVQGRRQARARRLRHARARRRQAAGRDRAHRRGPARPRLGRSAVARPGSRPACRSSRPPSWRPSRRHWSRCPVCSRCTRDPAQAGQRPHLQEPPHPSQLPPLLHRPGHLGQRHLDAERRALLVRPDPDELARRGRRPLLLPLRPVHRLRALRRDDRRPVRQPEDDHGHAGACRWASRPCSRESRSPAMPRSG